LRTITISIPERVNGLFFFSYQLKILGEIVGVYELNIVSKVDVSHLNAGQHNLLKKFTAYS
jgi:hypothetical protein